MKDPNRHCVYEYYESKEAKQPYYVGEGVVYSRPYKKHRVVSSLKEQVRTRPHRFSEKLKEIIRSGDLVPKDESLIKIVKIDLTKMEAHLEETKLIKKYGRITKLFCDEKNSLVNIQPGFDMDLMREIKRHPSIIDDLNEAYELAIKKDDKFYSIESYDDAHRLLHKYGKYNIHRPYSRLNGKIQEHLEVIKPKVKKQKTSAKQRKKLNKNLKDSVEQARKMKEFTGHQGKLITELWEMLENSRESLGEMLENSRES